MTDTGARPWLHRCSVCDEKMGTEEVIVVNKNVYHARHFKCYACQQEIAITDQFHLLEKERAVCISCFASTFAPVCSGCHRGIVDNCVRASGQHFHRKCFNCTSCGIALTNEFFLDGSGNFVDRACFWQSRLLTFVVNSGHKSTK